MSVEFSSLALPEVSSCGFVYYVRKFSKDHCSERERERQRVRALLKCVLCQVPFNTWKLDYKGFQELVIYIDPLLSFVGSQFCTT
eukprot:3730170-Amphidinium_carterae.1